MIHIILIKTLNDPCSWYGSIYYACPLICAIFCLGKGIFKHFPGIYLITISEGEVRGYHSDIGRNL